MLPLSRIPIPYLHNTLRQGAISDWVYPEIKVRWELMYQFLEQILRQCGCVGERQCKMQGRTTTLACI